MRPKLRAVCAAGALTALLAAAGCGSDDQGVGPAPKSVAGARLSWGVPATGKPRAVVMLLPGGGWEVPKPGYKELRASAPNIQAQGYATVAVEYAAGAKALPQIEAVYRAAKKQFPGVPVCATGISAGGHLALMLATREPDLACVAAISAPTDLTKLGEQGGSLAQGLANKAFGSNRLARYSPVTYAGKIKASVLLVNAESDPVVPAEQGRDMKAALPRAQLMILPPGPDPAEFAHFGGVQPSAQRQVLDREFDFLKAAAAGGSNG